jgi:hypothetical protein
VAFDITVLSRHLELRRRRKLLLKETAMADSGFGNPTKRSAPAL